MVYWAEFHLEAGSLLQTCVLLINPVAFLLIVFGLSFLFKEEKSKSGFALPPEWRCPLCSMPIFCFSGFSVTT